MVLRNNPTGLLDYPDNGNYRIRTPHLFIDTMIYIPEATLLLINSYVWINWAHIYHSVLCNIYHNAIVKYHFLKKYVRHL